MSWMTVKLELELGRLLHEYEILISIYQTSGQLLFRKDGLRTEGLILRNSKSNYIGQEGA